MALALFPRRPKLGEVGANFLVGGSSSNPDDFRAIDQRIVDMGWAEFLTECALKVLEFGATWAVIRNPGGVVVSEGNMQFDQWLRAYPDDAQRHDMNTEFGTGLLEFQKRCGFLPWIYLGYPETDEIYGSQERGEGTIFEWVQESIKPFIGCPIVIDHAGLGDEDCMVVARSVEELGSIVAIEPEPYVQSPWQEVIWPDGTIRQVHSFTQSNYYRKLTGPNPPTRIIPRQKRVGKSYIFVEETPDPELAEVCGWLRQGIHVAFWPNPGWRGLHADQILDAAFAPAPAVIPTVFAE